MWLPSWPKRFGAGRTDGRREQVGAGSRRRRLAGRLSVERLEDRLAPAAGALDPTFGTGGKVTTPGPDPFGFPTELHAEAVVLQPDGMILAAGELFSVRTFASDFAVVRYRPDGSPDPGFKTNGIATTDFTDRDAAHSVALQADGKIVVAGQTGLFSVDFALARLNADGSPDLSFGDPFSSSGPSGKVTTDFANGFDVASKVVIAADGKILVAGSVQTDHGIDFAVARYTSNGRLDTGFGTGGWVTTDFGRPHDNGGGDNDFASDMVIQADGKIVVAGTAHVSGPDFDDLDFGLARYTADGKPDTGFGTGGIVTTDFAGGADLAKGVAVLANGKIVVAGAADVGGSSAFALAHYNSDGSPDNSFDGDGKVTTLTTGVVGGVALQADGRCVAAGSAGPSNSADFALARFNADGSLDNSFGTGGQLTTDFGADDRAFAVALQPDGKIVAAGGTLTLSTDNSFNPQDLALARYEGALPEIAVSVGTGGLDSGSTIAYGSTLQGTPVSKTFVIRNLGNLNLFVSSIGVPAGYQLTTTTLFPLIVAPGAQARVNVQLTAGTAGIFNGRISIGNNDGDENPFVINVTGIVLAPAHEIQVLNGATDIPDNTGVFNFGTAAHTFDIFSGVVTRTFTVRNIGNSPLALGSTITVPSSFSLVSGFGSTILPPGASTTFAVGLITSLLVGTFSGQVSFANNDGDENPFNFTVTGAVSLTSTAPMIRGESLTRQVDEGGVATLRGHLVDPDPQDDLFLSIDWGDGTPVDAHNVGHAPFAFEHRYLDDPSGTAADEFPVHFTWFDSGGGSNSRTLPVTVNNVAPRVSVGLPAILRAGEALARVGSFTDPGLDSWYVTVDYGDGRGPQWLPLGPDNSFALSNRYTRPGVYKVQVRVFDDDGGVGTATLTVNVRNAPPQLFLGGVEVVRAGEVMRHTGSFTDPDSNTWRATVDYGDGSGPQPLAVLPGQRLSFEHRYTRPGQYHVTVTVLDDDGGLATDSFLVIVL